MITIDNFEILMKIDFTPMNIRNIYCRGDINSYAVSFTYNSLEYMMVIYRPDDMYSLALKDSLDWEIAYRLPLNQSVLERPYRFMHYLISQINDYNQHTLMDSETYGLL
jgi:hypothetical protein